MRKTFFKILFAFALFLPFSVVAQQNLPAPQGYVNDFAGILSNRPLIEQELADFDAQTSNEIAVVTVSSLDGSPIEDYAVRLFENWQIGKKDKDNGVLLLVAPHEKEVRIEVGYGLEGALPDITASSIIRNEILPHFKENDYTAGTAAGISAIMLAVQGEYTGTNAGNAQTSITARRAIPFIIFWVVIILLLVFASKGKKNGLLWFILGMLLGGRGPRGRDDGGFGGFGGGSSGGGGASGRW